MKAFTVATVLAFCLATFASPLEEKAFRCHAKTVTHTRVVTHTHTKLKIKTLPASTVTVTALASNALQTVTHTLPASTVTATVMEGDAPKTVTSMSISISTISACPSQGLGSNMTLSPTKFNSTVLPSLTASPSSTSSKTSSTSTSSTSIAKASPTSLARCPGSAPFVYPPLTKNYLNCGNNTARNPSYYYLQISGTGTNIDGSLLISFQYGDGVSQFDPYNTTYSYDTNCGNQFDPLGPMPFTWDQSSNRLVDGYGEPLSNFPESTTTYWSQGGFYGNQLSCYVTGSSLQVNCNTTDSQSGVVYDQLSVSGGNAFIIGEQGSSQRAATFNLVAPCAS